MSVNIIQRGTPLCRRWDFGWASAQKKSIPLRWLPLSGGAPEEPALATCSLHFACSCYSLLTCLDPCVGVRVCITRMLVPEAFMGCVSVHHSFIQLVWNIKAVQNHARNQGNAASGFKQTWIATRGTGRRIPVAGGCSVPTKRVRSGVIIWYHMFGIFWKCVYVH